MTNNNVKQYSVIPDVRLLFTGIFLMVLCWLSIFLAYALFPTSAWSEKFDLLIFDWPPMTGALIEGGRSLIFFVFFIGILGPQFQASRRTLLTFSQQSWWSIICKIILILTALWFGSMVIQWHFLAFGGGDSGPAELHRWTNSDSLAKEKGIESSSPQEHSFTYLVFFPYSIVIYGIISPLLFAIPLYSFGVDIVRLIKETHVALELAEKEKENEALGSAFRDYTEVCLVIGGRYLTPLGILVVLMVYDFVIGTYTVNEGALRRIQLGWGIVGLVTIYILTIGWFYSTALEKFKTRLRDIQFRKENNMIRFFEELFLCNMFGSVTLGLGAFLLMINSGWLKLLGIGD